MVLLLRLLLAALAAAAAWTIPGAAGDRTAVKHGLRVSVRDQSLQHAPSCQHSIAQIELFNVVRWFAGWFGW